MCPLGVYDDPDQAALREVSSRPSLYPDAVRRNTMLALMLLLAAIALAGVLGVLRIYQMTAP
jgi:hypothetical protein